MKKFAMFIQSNMGYGSKILKNCPDTIYLPCYKLNIKLTGTFSIIVILLLALSQTIQSQEIEITNKCIDRLLEPKKDAGKVKDAYLLVYELQDLIWAEVDADAERQDGGLYENQEYYGYGKVDNEVRDRWAKEMEKVVLSCNGNDCDDYLGHSDISGGSVCNWHFFRHFSDKIHLCINAIREAAHSSVYEDPGSIYTREEAAFIAALANVICHEVMHHVDDVDVVINPDGHSENDSELNPIDPTTIVGLAAELVVLSPDYVPSISFVDIDADSEGYKVRVFLDVYNINERSGPANTKSLSYFDRNHGFNVQLSLGDYSEINEYFLSGIHGGDDERHWPEFFIPADANLDNWTFELEAFADSDNRIWEHSEKNNIDTKTISLWTDLAIENVVIACPYVTQYRTARVGWRELTYNVTVRNRDDDIATLPSELTFRYSDMWNGHGKMNKKTFYIPSLGPGDSHLIRDVKVDVPLEGEFDPLNEMGMCKLMFVVDEDKILGDKNRSNNKWTLLIDDDYFRPDYQVEILSVEGLYMGTAKVNCRVKNYGPEAADNTCKAGLLIRRGDGVENASGRTIIKPLQAAEILDFTIQQSHDYNIGLNYIQVDIDIDDDINENQYILNDETYDGESINFAYTTVGLDIERIKEILEAGIVTNSVREPERPEDITEFLLSPVPEYYVDPWHWLDYWLDEKIPDTVATDIHYGLDIAYRIWNNTDSHEVTEFVSTLTNVTKPTSTAEYQDHFTTLVIYNQHNTKLMVIRRQ